MRGARRGPPQLAAAASRGCAADQHQSALLCSSNTSQLPSLLRRTRGIQSGSLPEVAARLPPARSLPEGPPFRSPGSAHTRAPRCSPRCRTAPRKGPGSPREGNAARAGEAAVLLRRRLRPPGPGAPGGRQLRASWRSRVSDKDAGPGRRTAAKASRGRDTLGAPLSRHSIRPCRSVLRQLHTSSPFLVASRKVARLLLTGITNRGKWPANVWGWPAPREACIKRRPPCRPPAPLHAPPPPGSSPRLHPAAGPHAGEGNASPAATCSAQPAGGAAGGGGRRVGAGPGQASRRQAALPAAATKASSLISWQAHSLPCCARTGAVTVSSPPSNTSSTARRRPPPPASAASAASSGSAAAAGRTVSRCCGCRSTQRWPESTRRVSAAAPRSAAAPSSAACQSSSNSRRPER